jgi:hypothetical protein
MDNEYTIKIINLNEEARVGDLTNRGLYFEYNYMTPLSHTENQYSLYSCVYGSDRVKPMKINVCLEKDNKLLILSWNRIENLSFTNCAYLKTQS